MQMRKISLMFFSLALMLLLPVGILLSANGVSKAYASDDYFGYVYDLRTLELITDEEDFDEVEFLFIDSYGYPTQKELMDMQGQLSLIAKCKNLKQLVIHVPGLEIDAKILNGLDNLEVVDFVYADVNLEGVYAPSVNTIRFAYNSVKNASGVSGFTNLKELVLQYVDEFDYSSLDKLTKLENLGIVHCNTIDTTKLSNLPIKWLVIEYTGVTDYDRLFACIPNIEKMRLYVNMTNADTKNLKNMKNLSYFNIAGTYITDISFLKELPSIEELVLPTRLSDLSVLYELPNLNYVEFEGYTYMNVDQDLNNYFQAKGITFEFFNRWDGDNEMKLDYEIYEKLDSVIKSFGFTDKTTDIEKIDVVTEYVMDLIEYSWDRSYNDDGIQISSMTRAFEYNVGICYDYALLEEALLTLVGVDAYCVIGQAMDYDYEYDIVYSRGGHAWNMVNVDGEWYVLDATWCDDNNDYPNYKESPYYMKKDDTGVTWQEYYNSDNKEQYEYAIFDLEHDSYGEPNKAKSEQRQDFEVSYLDSIRLSTQPTKKHYEIGEELDLSGAVIEATYSSGSKSQIKLPSSEVTVTGFDNKTAGVKTLTLTYYGASTTLYVLVKQPVVAVSRISLSKAPTKTMYYLGEELDLSGAEITVHYDNNSEKVIALPNNEVTATGFRSTLTGKKYVKLTYKEKSVTQVVEVFEKGNIVSGDFVYDNIEKTVLIGVSEEGINKTKLTIPSGVKTIKSTFGNNTDLSKNPMNMVKVVLPKTVSTIEEGAFKRCFALWIVKNNSKVKFSTLTIKKKYFTNAATNNMDFTGESLVISQNNVAYFKPRASFCVAAAMIDRTKTSVVLSKNTTHVGQYAFYGSKIVNVTVPKKVTELGLKAFARCESLKTVTMEGDSDNTSNLTTIKAYAFYGDKALTKIVIPSKVNFVGKYALAQTGLTQVVVKNTANWVAGTTNLSAAKLKNATTAKTYFTKTYASKDIKVAA